MMLPHVMDQLNLPPELCVKPLCLVGVTGLDTVNNAIHKNIWDAFHSNRRVERASVAYKLLSNSHEFPVIKPKRNSYEWYIPKGILKRNWLNKHLNEVPAVIVIFYELNWNDTQWNEKMIECSSRVQSIRAALEARNTRITVVLIQQTVPLPASEDVLAAERAAALCGSCELNSKSLFVLPLGDHLQGYTVRLENAFYDLAQNYYHHEARNIKSHRDHLNKTTHQYLFVRHQFKMGFLNELKQDKNTALKHYNHAYNNLLEIRIVDTNALEIKTVAGFINYKICRIMFAQSQPRDAISQFRAHVDRFRSRLGFQELVFEHHAWLANEYNIFGDIFDEAVKLGLPAVQTQHPGFYYQQAAQHAILRKQTCLEYCKDVMTYPSPDPLEGIERIEFYGQRPWRPGKLSAEPPDPEREQSGIQALQYIEKQVNHSNLIISYYGQAISQFKTYKCPRMRSYLVVQMADEYYNSCDYGKALTLLTHMLWDYRCEAWWNIISDILRRALKCAYLCANVQDYITISLEILGKSTTIPQQDKIRVFNNLMLALKKSVPEPEENLSQTEISKAITNWRSSVQPELNIISVDMSNVVSCIESKARFTQSKFEVDTCATIEVFIRSTCPNILHFSHLSVTINTPSFNSEFAVSEREKESTDNNQSLLFQSNEVKKFLVEFMPDVKDIGQEIQIGSILLHLGQKNERVAILRFTGNSSYCSYPELSQFRVLSKNVLDFDNITPLGTTMIVPRLSKVKMDVSFETPALVGEWYEMKVNVENAELMKINKVEVNVSLEMDEVGSEAATEFSVKPEVSSLKNPFTLNLPDLDVNETISSVFYMHSNRTGDRNITLRLSYFCAMEKLVESVKEIVVNITVTKPFEVTTKFMSTKFETISNCFAKEPFVIMPQVRCCAPVPIVIEKTTFELNPYIKNMEENTRVSQLVDVQLQNEEMGAEIYTLRIDKRSDQAVPLGSYVLHWRRKSSDVLNTTCISLKGLAVEEIPFYVETVLPAYGFVRTPMSVAFHFYNRTHQLIQLELSMDLSEAFMFAGYKQIQIAVLPMNSKIVKYNMYPLVPGNVLLPKLKLTLDETDVSCALLQNQVTSLLNRCIPTHVYIMPQIKGIPNKTQVTTEVLGQ